MKRQPWYQGTFCRLLTPFPLSSETVLCDARLSRETLRPGQPTSTHSCVKVGLPRDIGSPTKVTKGHLSDAHPLSVALSVGTPLCPYAIVYRWEVEIEFIREKLA